MIPRVFSRRKGAPKPPFGEPYVYVGRPSRWGNPFARSDGHLDPVEAFRNYVRCNVTYREQVRAALAGKHLVCWCAPARCHADVLLRVANGGEA